MREGIHNIPKKESHLKEGVKPIMVCIGKTKDDDMTIDQTRVDSAHFVNFLGGEEYLKERNFLNAGKATYVISPTDDLDKFSPHLFDCTSLVVTGREKQTGSNISFITHQNPRQFLNNKKTEFLEDLEKKIKEIKERCDEGTIDSVIVGGNYNHLSKSELSKVRRGKSEEVKKTILDKIEEYHQNYIGSVSLISDEVKKVLGFDPVIVNGPKNSRGPDSIYYDTEKRRLYFERPKINVDAKDFTIGTLHDEKKKWGKNSY